MPQEGFEWVDYESPLRDLAEARKVFKARRLRPKSQPGRRRRKYVEPLREPSLFRRFADLYPVDEARVLEFANTFGDLGKDPLGETLAVWKRGVWSLRRAVKEWDAYREGVFDSSSDLFLWDDSGRDVPLSQAEDYILRPDEDDEDEAAPAAPPDLDRDEAALRGLKHEVNANLREEGVDPLLMGGPDDDRLRLHLVPRNLLAALWLQLAEAIDRERDYRRCELCGKWFDITSDDAGARKMFCSNACRSKAYRQRIERARKLRQGGATLKDIAAQLDSTVKTVRHWVSGTGRQ